MISINDYEDPFQLIDDFEKDIAQYTNAPYVVTTDCCTHAIELCFRYLISQDTSTLNKTITIPKKTYLSIPMVFHKLGIPYKLIDGEWNSEYNFGFTNIWDSARCLINGMYKTNQVQCLSFGRTKPLEIGRGGAILLSDKKMYTWLKRARYDGRDLTINPWQAQTKFQVGYHYMMRPEECVIGRNMLQNNEITNSSNFTYPDLSKCVIE
jgi:dTDP-4-amino-4,6-dideoxygalactose transaminase